MSSGGSASNFAMKLSSQTILFLVLLFVQNSLTSSHSRYRRNKLRSRDGRSFTHSRTGESCCPHVVHPLSHSLPPDAVSSSCNDGSGFSSRKRIVCYYRVEQNFRPYDLDPCLCTHVVYSYVAIRDNFAFVAGKKGKQAICAPLVAHLCRASTKQRETDSPLVCCKQQSGWWSGLHLLFQTCRKSGIAY